MTANADGDMPGFVRQASNSVGVFAALPLVAVTRFGEERLGLLWRDTMTRMNASFGIVRPKYVEALTNLSPAIREGPEWRH
jgi:hypothetical protein